MESNSYKNYNNNSRNNYKDNSRNNYKDNNEDYKWKISITYAGA